MDGWKKQILQGKKKVTARCFCHYFVFVRVFVGNEERKILKAMQYMVHSAQMNTSELSYSLLFAYVFLSVCMYECALINI